jgi:hypothetical protein
MTAWFNCGHGSPALAQDQICPQVVQDVLPLALKWRQEINRRIIAAHSMDTLPDDSPGTDDSSWSIFDSCPPRLGGCRSFYEFMSLQC